MDKLNIPLERKLLAISDGLPNNTGELRAERAKIEEEREITSISVSKNDRLMQKYKDEEKSKEEEK